MREVRLAAVAAATLVLAAAATAGAADAGGGAGFGNLGIAMIASGDAAADPSSLAVEPDGTVIVAADGGTLFRLTRTGARSGFGPSHGPVLLPAGGGCSPAIAVDGAGRVAVACGGIVARLLPNGRFDPRFGRNGVVRVAGVRLSTLALATGGRLLVGGTVPTAGGVPPVSGALIRLLADGEPDRAFGQDGRLDVPSAFRLANAVAVDGLGRVLVAAGSLFRYDTAGAPDATFGTSGRVDIEGFDAAVLAVQHDGRVVTAGAVRTTAVLRLLDNGSRDPTFASGGVLLPNGYTTPTGIALQRDGGVVVTAEVTGSYGVLDWAVQRLRADGSVAGSGRSPGLIDPDTNCWSETPNAVGETPDGKIVVAGGACFEGDTPQLYAMRFTHTLDLDAGRRLVQTRVGRVIVRREADGLMSITSRVTVSDAAQLSAQVRWTQLEPVGPCPPPGAAKPCPTQPEPAGPPVRLAPGSGFALAKLRGASTAIWANVAGGHVVRVHLLFRTRALWRHQPYVVTIDASDARGRAARRIVLRFTAP